MIGSWDNSNCIFAILPKCLQNGSNPEPITSGIFPVYNGPKATENHYVDFDGYYYTSDDNLLNSTSGVCKYEAGKLVSLQQPDHRGGYEIKAQDLFKKFFDPSTSLTLEYWVDYVPVNTPGIPTGKYLSTGWFSNPDYPESENPINKYVFTLMISNLAGVSAGKVIFRLGGPTDANTTPHTIARNVSNVSSALLEAGDVHIVFVKNGSDFNFYVNGESLGNAAVIPLEVFNNPIDDGHVINGFGYGPTDFDGWRNDLYSTIMYDKALTSEQILANYNLGTSLGGLYGYDNNDNTMLLTPNQIFKKIYSLNIAGQIIHLLR
jgi:hypothetical protein